MSCCPICQKKTYTEGAMHINGSRKCPDRHYWENNDYGRYELFLDVYGDGCILLDVRWDDSESRKEISAREKAIKAFLNYAKVLKDES